jgi:hypothetical protein
MKKKKEKKKEEKKRMTMIKKIHNFIGFLRNDLRYNK